MTKTKITHARTSANMFMHLFILIHTMLDALDTHGTCKICELFKGSHHCDTRLNNKMNFISQANLFIFSYDKLAPDKVINLIYLYWHFYFILFLIFLYLYWHWWLDNYMAMAFSDGLHSHIYGSHESMNRKQKKFTEVDGGCCMT